MTQCRLSLLLTAVLFAPLAAKSQSAAPCVALAGIKIDGIEITKAVSVPAGTTVWSRDGTRRQLEDDITMLAIDI